jgi:murein DD-endopeptidase MepM/ murein hydrolase activator NlpD
MRGIAAAVLSFLWVLPSLSHAEQIRVRVSKTSVYQSDVIKIQLIKKSSTPFSVHFLDRTYDSFRMGKYHTALIGIDYQLKPGTYSLTAVYQIAPNYFVPFPYVIRVKQKFPKLKGGYVAQKRTPSEQQRINEESAEKGQVLKEKSYRRDAIGYFTHSVLPVKVNAPFGEKRCRDRVRGKWTNCRYHLGVDYRAAFDATHSSPVAVAAINSGKVIFVGDHLADGKIIIIDHGNGISSGYLHLSRFLVKKGDWVRRGQKIGVAGKTGATNAIHLHLFVKMDNGKTTVDPEKLLRLLRK